MEKFSKVKGMRFETYPDTVTYPDTGKSKNGYRWRLRRISDMEIIATSHQLHSDKDMCDYEIEIIRNLDKDTETIPVSE